MDLPSYNVILNCKLHPFLYSYLDKYSFLQAVHLYGYLTGGLPFLDQSKLC